MPLQWVVRLTHEIINILDAASPAPTITGGLTAANIAKAKTELNCCFADPSKPILLVGCDQEEALLNLADINSSSMFQIWSCKLEVLNHFRIPSCCITKIHC